MLSQFTKEGEHPTLADLEYEFDKDIYPVGRLDADSEGMLLLTNDNFLKTKLLDPKNKHSKTYYSQVEGDIDEPACVMLRKGVSISINGKRYKTLPAGAELLPEPTLPERNPPVRFRKNIPTSWVALTLHEGKNRQVRKMTAAVGFPTLRLVRWSIGAIRLSDFDLLLPGMVVELRKADIAALYR
ncbi:23S rRNA pseudouridine2457 synthase [Dyadobacter jejuensis]|uniref:23S rRNA pseudouridine2457 synthase n=2 Tax=Dyadobacter jejuensis TaxID=1082580 RepID=A0A316ASP5_9BACT|nr:23S rRNA pseudouridine2457 synthase [Dyadobacter jejuensis]